MLLSFAYLAFSAVLRCLSDAGATGSPKTPSCSCCDINSPYSDGMKRAPRCGRQSCLPRRARPRASAAAPTRVDCDAADASALASRTRAPEVGAAAAKPRPSARQRSGARARAAPGARESALGLSADRGRAAEARPARLAEHCAAATARSRSSASAETLGAELAGLPGSARISVYLTGSSGGVVTIPAWPGSERFRRMARKEARDGRHGDPGRADRSAARGVPGAGAVDREGFQNSGSVGRAGRLRWF